MTNQQVSDLGAAGVPQDAIKRLSELQPGKAGSIFTSDLSVNEFLLVKEAGFHPRGVTVIHQHQFAAFRLLQRRLYGKPQSRPRVIAHHDDADGAHAAHSGGDFL